MKKLIFVVLTIFCFSANVFAADYEAAPDECLDNNSCILTCNYVNDFGGIRRTMSIFYHFNGGWSVRYWNQLTGDSYYGDAKGPSSFSSIFSSSGSPNIYWFNGTNENNFKCPEHGYFDRHMVPELCFSDDPEDCKKKFGAFSTRFGESDTGFTWDVKNYDIEEDLTNYANWIIQDVVADITNGSFNAKEDIENKILTDIKTNYFKGNVLPQFIVNMEAYENLKKNALEEYEKYKKQELEQAEADFNEGKITEEELTEIKDNWSATGEEVAQNVAQALDQIAYESYNFIPNWEGATCDSLLGSTTNENDPAYYLNFAFKFIKYIAIVMLLGLSVMDYFKAVMSSDNDALKKATQKAIKRIIICVIIFFLPILIDFIFRLLGVVSDPTCGIGG